MTAHVVELVDLGSRVFEIDVLDAGDRARGRVDSVEAARVGEFELEAAGALELVVGAGRGHLGDELREVARVAHELLVLVVDDVGAHRVEEASVVLQ